LLWVILGRGEGVEPRVLRIVGGIFGWEKRPATS